MAGIILSVGVHRNELDAARYAGAVAEALRKKGHDVQIVKRKESSTVEALDLNFRRVMLGVLWDWAGFRAESDPLLRRQRFLQPFIRSLSDAEKRFLDSLLESPDVKRVFASAQYKVTEKKLKTFGLKLSDRLLPLFKQHHSIMKKAWEHGVSLSYVMGDTLSLQFQIRRGDARYRRGLSRKNPLANVIDLHNTPENIAVEPDWVELAPGVLARKDVAKSEFRGGHHGKKGKPLWITIEFLSAPRYVKENGGFGQRFFSADRSLRAGTTSFERMYATQYFPRNSSKENINPVVNWIHRNVSRKRLAKPRIR